jgi:hypothetical protein
LHTTQHTALRAETNGQKFLEPSQQKPIYEEKEEEDKKTLRRRKA